MKRLLYVWAVLVFAVTAGCNRSSDSVDQQINEPAAMTGDVTAGAQAIATDGEQTGAVTPVDDGELPATSSLLPLAGAIGVVSLGGALILRSLRRRRR